MKTVIQTPSAPKTIGPYSQAVRAGGFLFLSGQIPLDPVTGEVVGGSIEAQTEQVMKNLSEVLSAGGSSLEKVVKSTMYVKSLEDFPRVNAIYARFFPENPPARSTVEVSRLPRDVSIEIDVIAEAG